MCIATDECYSESAVFLMCHAPSEKAFTAEHHRSNVSSKHSNMIRKNGKPGSCVLSSAGDHYSSTRTCRACLAAA